MNAPQAGVVLEILVSANDKVLVGAPLLKLGAAGSAPSASAPSAAATAAASAPAAPEAKTKSAPPPPGAKKPAAPVAAAAPAPSPSAAPSAAAAPTAAKKPAVAAASFSSGGAREERRERLSKMRRVIAQRLKDSQNTYAMLTTFQECDMSALFQLREKYGEAFAKKHGGVKLGFMSAFVKVFHVFFKTIGFGCLMVAASGCCHCSARVARSERGD